MHAAWYRFGSPQPAPSLLVIDTDSKALWQGPFPSVLEGVRDRYAADAVEVVFLGGRRGGSAAEALAAATGANAQLCRYPVLGPALREWARRPRPVLLVTAVAPHDWADWNTDDVRDRLLVYRVAGADRVSPPGFREVGPDADFDTVISHLDDPVRRAEVGGAGTFAIDWLGGVRPHGQSAEVDWPPGDVRIRIVHPPDRPPVGRLLRASGRAEPLALERVSDPPPLPPVGVLPAERQAARTWLAGRSAWCAACGRGHSPGRVRCDGDTRLFPSLASGTAYGVSADASFHPLRCGRAVAVDGRLLAVEGAGVTAYSYADGGWRLDGGPLTDFPELADGGFLLRV